MQNYLRLVFAMITSVGAAACDNAAVVEVDKPGEKSFVTRDGVVQSFDFKLNEHRSRDWFMDIRLANGKTVRNILLNRKNCTTGSAVRITTHMTGDPANDDRATCNLPEDVEHDREAMYAYARQCEQKCSLPVAMETDRLRLRKISKQCGEPDLDFTPMGPGKRDFQIDLARITGSLFRLPTPAEVEQGERQARAEAALPCIEAGAIKGGMTVKFPVTIVAN